VRILRLLEQEELSVAELQEILGMGQSRISMQLSQLKQAGLVEVRRMGQKSLYRCLFPQDAQTLISEALRRSTEELTATAQDDAALRLVLQKRKDRMRHYFDDLAGRFGRDYVPGRNWKSFSEMLLKLMPPLVIADVGAGEGTVALMLAQSAERVIAVDHSEKMREYALGIAGHSLDNFEYRLGDLEDLPLLDGEVDLALFHQSLHHAVHPFRALEEAWRVLKPGGRVAIVDLLKHGVTEAREIYADVWLGFSEVELLGFLKGAGFDPVSVTVVHKEDAPPHFETVLAIGHKVAKDSITTS
jgi:ubiquinone/menaquinone biosynthesis C-methylase UbiE